MLERARLLILVLGTMALFEASAWADYPNCAFWGPPPPGSNDIVVEQIDVRFPGTSVFVPPPSNLCVDRRDGRLHFGIVGNGQPTQELDPGLPIGTWLRISLRHTKGNSFGFGTISVQGSDGALHNHGQHGGDRTKVTVLVQTADLKPNPWGVPCQQNVGYKSYAAMLIPIYRIRGEWTQVATPGFTVRQNSTPGLQLDFGERFSFTVSLFGCPRPGAPYDSKHETYYSRADILKIFKHTESVMAITPSMARLLIKPELD